MKKFVKLVGEDHSHIAWLDDETGEALCAVAGGEENPHLHQIQYSPPQVDEAGNVIGKPQWVVIPTDHEHDVKQVPVEALKRPEDESTDDDVVSNVYLEFGECIDHEADSLDRFEKANDFFVGDQWSDGERQALKSADRACLTINVTQKHVLEISGYQRENRQDMVYMPTEDGDQRVADMYSHVAKHVLERCFYWREEAKVFLDEVIGGRGMWNLYIDYAKKLEGQIVVERFPWQHARMGPHEKEDGSDCEVMFKEKWYSKDKLKQLHPEKAEKIEQDYSQVGTGSHPTTASATTSPNDYPVARQSWSSCKGKALVDRIKKQYCVVERWRRIFVPTMVMASPDRDFTYSTIGWSKEDQDQAASLDGFIGIPRTMEAIRITKTAGGVLLADELPAELPSNDFHMVPVYALKRDDKFWGKVEQAFDSQVALNKRYSQGIDIGNKAINYGRYYDDATFHTDEDKESFKKNSTKPGFIQRVMDSTRPPNKEEGSKFPAEVVNLMEVDRAQVNEMMNIQVDPQGANDSASKLMQLVKMKLKGNEYLFDGLTFSKQKLGRLLLPMIQKTWSPRRIFRLLSSNNAKAPMNIAGQPFENYTEAEILELLSRVDVEEYDVSVAEIAYSPTMRMAIFSLLSDLASKGAPIPPEVLLKFAGLPKEVETEVVTTIQQQNDSMAQGETAKANAEIAKTVIAKTGVVPPAVQQQLGMTPPQEQTPSDPSILGG